MCELVLGRRGVLGVGPLGGTEDLVTGLEPRVRALGRAVEHHQVAVDRVELGERPIDFLAVLFDPDPAVEPGVTLTGEVELRRSGDEPLKAEMGGNGHD